MRIKDFIKSSMTICLVIAFVSVGLVQLSVLAEPVSTDPLVCTGPLIQPDDPGFSECKYKCTLCPPNAKRCNLVCTWVGKCDSRCGFIEVCNDGFAWSERACRCVPER